MSETERKQYEEAAKEYVNKIYAINKPQSKDIRNVFENGIDDFLVGCSHAHSKIEEAEREEWNRAIDEVSDMVSNAFSGRSGDDLAHAEHEIIEELKKLRK